MCRPDEQYILAFMVGDMEECNRIDVHVLDTNTLESLSISVRIIKIMHMDDALPRDNTRTLTLRAFSAKSVPAVMMLCIGCKQR